MPYYRLYCLDGSGKFTKAHELEAANDEAALAVANEMRLSVKCELWERNRMVAALDGCAPKELSTKAFGG